MNGLTTSAEDYLKTIRILSLGGIPVREVDLARALCVSKPSVSRAVARLKESGLLTVRGHILRLTPTGDTLADEICVRFYLLRGLLVCLGVSAAVAERDACRMEHGLSPETADCIQLFLNHEKPAMHVIHACAGKQ